VHLDELMVVRLRAVDDDEREVVIDVDLRALVELLGILDGERMELENLAQDVEVFLGWPAEIEPEEAVAIKKAFDRCAVERHFGRACVVDDLASRRVAQLFWCVNRAHSHRTDTFIRR
jgi:hypothetical protein